MKDDKKFLRKITSVLPSKRQIAQQEMGFYAFIHYGMNSFTDKEWGDGTDPVERFNPRALHTDQWCEAIMSAGMKGVIITAKHHDGFCLWDTAYTDYSTMHSPYGKDIVKQLAASCKKYNLKLGIYLSPWDRNHSSYGYGDAYNDYFCNQLTELLTNYGDIFCAWFDGACGEGTNGKKQVYDWLRFYDLIRKLQPEACISVCGPDIRWCGNEAGRCRTSEWSVVPAYMADNEKIHGLSQQEDHVEFRERLISEDEDLGSRKILANVTELVWYPAEVNTSIRPGWFYHEAEDDQVKSFEHLRQVYLQSVGGNGMFLLNLPPHPNGYLHDNDVRRLEEIGNWLKHAFAIDLLVGAKFEASSELGESKISNVQQDDGFWQSLESDETPWVMVKTDELISPEYLLLQEEVLKSQRIEAFKFSYLDEAEQWQVIAEGTVVGYKRICEIKSKISANCFKLNILSCRLGATLSTFSMY